MELAFPAAGRAGTASSPMPVPAGATASPALRAASREELLNAILDGLPDRSAVVFPQLLDLDFAAIVCRRALRPRQVAARLFQHDLAALADAAGTDCRLVYLTNPNDVTGSRLPLDLLRSFIGLLPAHTLLLLDETAAEAPEDDGWEEGALTPEAGSRLLRMLTAGESVELRGEALRGFAGAIEAQPMPRIDAGAEAARRAQLAEVERLLDAANLQHVPTTTGFLCFRAPQAAAFLARLRAAGVPASVLAHVGMSDWLRVAVAREDEAAGLAAVLREFLKGGDV